MVLQQGEAVRISTGAPVPDSANAVVQIEDTIPVINGDIETGINLTVVAKPQQEIRLVIRYVIQVN